MAERMYYSLNAKTRSKMFSVELDSILMIGENFGFFNSSQYDFLQLMKKLIAFRKINESPTAATKSRISKLEIQLL